MEHLYREAFANARGARHALLVSHPKPDGDTLGAMLAFGNILDALGVRHTRFCRDAVPKQYRFLPGAERVVSDAEIVRRAEPDVIFTFDAGDLRFAGIQELVTELGNPRIVNVDHHLSNERFGHLNVLVTDASSTAEVVHRLLAANGISVDREVATCLLTGLCTDTSNFSNPATSATALELGAELLRRGAKFSSVLWHVVRNKSVASLHLWGVALSRLIWNERYGVASTVLTAADLEQAGADEEAAEGISNFLSGALRVPTVLVLREAPGGLIRGSLRTVEDRDVARLARTFGGGGHRKAAGFTIRGRLVKEQGRWRVVAA